MDRAGDLADRRVRQWRQQGPGSTETGGEGGEPTGGKSGEGTGGSATGGKSGTGGSVPVDARAPDPDGGSGGSTGGSGGSDAAAPADGGSSTGGAGGAGGAPACGKAGQMCCQGDTCGAGATPMPGAAGGGMMVLELHASGGDPYAYFGMKDLLPIDGPASGYITDEGTHFKFVLHQNGAEETVSSGAKRQRNELTVNPGNPAIYKGMHGDTMSYTWRFKPDQDERRPHLVRHLPGQAARHPGPAPFAALEADKGDLTLDTQRLGVVARVPLSTILNTWINASVTPSTARPGSLR
jgi:hypothetical protein